MQPFFAAAVLWRDAENCISDSAPSESGLLMQKPLIEVKPRVSVAGAEVEIAVAGEDIMDKVLEKISENTFLSSRFRGCYILAVRH